MGADDDGMAMMLSQRESQLAQTISIERTHTVIPIYFCIVARASKKNLSLTSHDIYTFKGNETVIVSNKTTIFINDNSLFDVCGHTIVIGIVLFVVFINKHDLCVE